MSLLAIAVVLVGFLSAALSAIAGLGGGTVLIGVLYAIGLHPTVAVPLFSAVQFFSNLSRTLAYLRHVEWRALGWFALTGVPAPFLFAPLVAHADVHWIELVLAALILLSMIPARGGRDPIPQHWSFMLAGLLNGSIGMFVGATGLFVGRLFLRPEWRRETVIGTLAVTQAAGHLLKVLAYASAGFSITERLDWLVPLVIAVIAGTVIGRWFNRLVSEALFARLFKTILIVLSLKLLADGVLGLGGWSWSLF